MTDQYLHFHSYEIHKVNNIPNNHFVIPLQCVFEN